MTKRAAQWIEQLRSGPAARLRLLCVPYAGAGPDVFRPWAELLPPTVDLWAAQLPGRATRIREQPPTSLEPLVASLADALEPHLGLPVALFGHSMGALIAFELAREIRRRGLSEPAQLFVSGCEAPQLAPQETPVGHLSDDELLQRIREFAGTPEEVLQHVELMRFFLPVLRADFCVVESYAYHDHGPLSCPLSAFGGMQDPTIDRERLEAWRLQSLSLFRLRMIPGGHFYLDQARPVLLQAILYDLQTLV